ncbi:MAG: hypothetical protein R2727_11235 [Bacteroidales bacterium]
MTVELKANEVVIKAGDTTQAVGNTTVRGKLIVTNQRIYFKAIETELKSYDLEINPENIQEVIYFGNGLFSAKGLDVVTTTGQSHKFPLKKRDEIGKLINSMY